MILNDSLPETNNMILVKRPLTIDRVKMYIIIVYS